MGGILIFAAVIDERLGMVLQLRRWMSFGRGRKFRGIIRGQTDKVSRGDRGMKSKGRTRGRIIVPTSTDDNEYRGTRDAKYGLMNSGSNASPSVAIVCESSL